MRGLYLYPRGQQQFLSMEVLSIHNLEVEGELVRYYTNTEKDAPEVRGIVWELCDSENEYTHLVLPDDFRLHTPVIEAVKLCARHCGMEVLPLTRFLQLQEPATADAVPPTQHPAVVGQPN